MWAPPLILTALMLAILLAGCGTSAGGELRCLNERTTTDSFDGLGVCYSSNVTVVVKNGAGYALVPSYREMNATATGTNYWTDVYLDDHIRPGVYTLEVRRCAVSCLAATYEIHLAPGESPLMTIVCL